MKPYRVKRGGKYIGSFLVPFNGKRVNLKTKDATEARRRAALLAKGKSWEGGDVAAEVRAAIEGEVLQPEEAAKAGGQSEGAGEGGRPDVPLSPAEPKPTAAPEPEPMPAPPPPPSAADAVNAAAAGLAGEVQAALAEGGFNLGELIGDQVSDADMGEVAVTASGYAGSALVWMADRWVEPVDLPPKLARVKPILGKLLRIEVSKWKLGLDNLSPRELLLYMLAGSALVQAFIAWRSLKAPAEAPAPDLRPVP